MTKSMGNQKSAQTPNLQFILALSWVILLNTSTATNLFDFSWKTSASALQEVESYRDDCGCREPSACDGNVNQSALSDNPEMIFNTLNKACGRGVEIAGPALQACFLANCAVTHHIPIARISLHDT